jgi:hypothetical protein
MGKSHVKDCLDRADECARLAETASNAERKQSYLELARTWRDLAINLDKFDQTTTDEKK